MKIIAVIFFKSKLIKKLNRLCFYCGIKNIWVRKTYFGAETSTSFICYAKTINGLQLRINDYYENCYESYQNEPQAWEAGFADNH